MTIYSYAKLQSIWTIPDCETKFGQKTGMVTILRNRHYINTIFICGIITLNSCDKFHIIW